MFQLLRTTIRRQPSDDIRDPRQLRIRALRGAVRARIGSRPSDSSRSMQHARERRPGLMRSAEISEMALRGGAGRATSWRYSAAEQRTARSRPNTTSVTARRMRGWVDVSAHADAEADRWRGDYLAHSRRQCCVTPLSPAWSWRPGSDVPPTSGATRRRPHVQHPAFNRFWQEHCLKIGLTRSRQEPIGGGHKPLDRWQCIERFSRSGIVPITVLCREQPGRLTQRTDDARLSRGQSRAWASAAELTSSAAG